MNLETENPMSSQQVNQSSLPQAKRTAELEALLIDAEAVSYTHLTLPTIYSV